MENAKRGPPSEPRGTAARGRLPANRPSHSGAGERRRFLERPASWQAAASARARRGFPANRPAKDPCVQRIEVKACPPNDLRHRSEQRRHPVHRAGEYGSSRLHFLGMNQIASVVIVKPPSAKGPLKGWASGLPAARRGSCRSGLLQHPRSCDRSGLVFERCALTPKTWGKARPSRLHIVRTLMPLARTAPGPASPFTGSGTASCSLVSVCEWSLRFGGIEFAFLQISILEGGFCLAVSNVVGPRNRPGGRHEADPVSRARSMSRDAKTHGGATLRDQPYW